MDLLLNVLKFSLRRTNAVRDDAPFGEAHVVNVSEARPGLMELLVRLAKALHDLVGYSRHKVASFFRADVGPANCGTCPP